MAGRTLFSKCPWLVMFPDGEYLATTKEEPSDAMALPTPSCLVLFHTIAVKWPRRHIKGEMMNRKKLESQNLDHVTERETCFYCSEQLRLSSHALQFIQIFADTGILIPLSFIASKSLLLP